MLAFELKEALSGLAALLGCTAHAHTRLYGDDSDGVLVADDSSLVSLLRLDGSLRILGEEEFDELCARLETVLSEPLGKKYHALQLVLYYDPSSGRETVGQQFAAVRRSARALHLELDEVLNDWEDRLAGLCAGEEVYLAIWTRPSFLPRAQLKEERKKAAGRDLRAAADLQAKCLSLERVRDRHVAQVKQFVRFFGEQSIKVVWLDCHVAIRTIRRMLVPEVTARDWRPRLSGDRCWPMAPGTDSQDAGFLLPPTLARQIWPTDVRIIGQRFVQVGRRIYSPFYLSLPPQTCLPFNTLFQGMKGTSPWLASFLLSGDGLGGLGLTGLLSQVLSFASSGNTMVASAYKMLKELELAGSCIVGFQAAFATWVDALADPAPLDLLSRRSSALQSQVQSWGSCETEESTGDPLLGLSSCLPSLMPTSPAPKALAPLGEAIRLLPITRPASPWDQADLPLRTPDGKFMPLGLFHSRQASWNEVVFAGMGAGKSFFLNTLNFFFLLRPGQVRLPWLTVIDIGPSSSGLINLIKWALPKELRHLAVFAKIKNLASRAINPFDTPLGCPYPLRSHLEFLNNLLCLLCTPLDRTAPVDGVASLLREACDHLYREMAPDGSRPRRFDAHLEPQVTKMLHKLNFVQDDQTTWWEVVDVLAEAGEYALALTAQSHAMPLMADLASIVTEHNVAENYLGILAGPGGESVPQACSRYLVAALKEYPVLSNPTRFSLGAARIIGLDLSEVTPRGGAQAQRQSAIMYMLARFVGAAHFFTSLDDLEEVPEPYVPYHRERFEALLTEPKRLCYDEFHRASCADMENPLSRQIISDLTTATRESRKLNLSIGLYSQRLADFPPELVAMATSVYALGAGNAREAQEIAERFGYNRAAYHALRSIRRPGPNGASFIALFRTSLGESIQYLTNSAGGYARWAFSTTAEDMRLRNRLYNAVGVRSALAALTENYPAGSVKEEIERRKHQEAETGERGRDAEEEIFQELLEASTKR